MTYWFWFECIKWVAFLSKFIIISRWYPTSFWNASWFLICSNTTFMTLLVGFKLNKSFSEFVHHPTKSWRGSWNSAASLNALSSFIFPSCSLRCIFIFSYLWVMLQISYRPFILSFYVIFSLLQNWGFSMFITIKIIKHYYKLFSYSLAVSHNSHIGLDETNWL